MSDSICMRESIRPWSMDCSGPAPWPAAGCKKTGIDSNKIGIASSNGHGGRINSFCPNSSRQITNYSKQGRSVSGDFRVSCGSNPRDPLRLYVLSTQRDLITITEVTM